MRRIISMSLGTLLAATLVHCTADGDVGEVVPPAEASAADVSVSDAGVDVATDAAEPKRDGGHDAGHCSADDWCRVPLPTEDLDLQAVWSFGPDDALAVGKSGMVHWDGSAWSAVIAPDAGLEGLTSLWASSPNDIWGVARAQRRLVHGSRTQTGKAGAAFTWSTQTFDGGPTLDSIRGFGTNDLWICGIDGATATFQHGLVPKSDTNDAGADAGFPSLTRVPIDAPMGFYVSSFGVTENNELWATGWMGSAIVYHGVPTEPNAATYMWEQSLNTDGMGYAYFLALWTPHADDIWAIGVPGSHFHRAAQSDGGLSWSPVANRVNMNLTSAWGSGKNDVWAVGSAGAIRHWDGKSWALSQVAIEGDPMYKDLTSVHGSSATDTWAVGPGVALHHGAGVSP